MRIECALAQFSFKLVWVQFDFYEQAFSVNVYMYAHTFVKWDCRKRVVQIFTKGIIIIIVIVDVCLLLLLLLY